MLPMQSLLDQYQGATSQSAQQLAGNALAGALAERRDLLSRIRKKVIQSGIDMYELPEEYNDPSHLTGLVFTEVFAKKARHRTTGQVRYIFQYRSDGAFVRFAADKLRKRFLRHKSRDRLRFKPSDPAHLNAVPSSTTSSKDKLRKSYFREHFGNNLVASLAGSRNNSLKSLIFCFVHRGQRITKRRRRKATPQLPKQNELLLKCLDDNDWLRIARAATSSTRRARRIVTLVWPEKAGTASALARALGISSAQINQVKNNTAATAEFQRCIDTAVSCTRQLADYYIDQSLTP